MEIKNWEEYFLDLAKTCASRSNCLRAQVGAVIVGDDKKIKATGYNGTPSKVESCYDSVVQSMLNKMQLSKQVKIDARVLRCISGDIILFVSCVKDLLFNRV